MRSEERKSEEWRARSGASGEEWGVRSGTCTQIQFQHLLSLLHHNPLHIFHFLFCPLHFALWSQWSSGDAYFENSMGVSIVLSLECLIMQDICKL